PRSAAAARASAKPPRLRGPLPRIPRVRTRAVTVRMAALVGVGACAVHHLRFMLWYEQGSDGTLGAQGHAYLGVVGPVVLVAAIVASAGFLDRLARGARTSAPRFRRLWGAVSAL